MHIVAQKQGVFLDKRICLRNEGYTFCGEIKDMKGLLLLVYCEC